MSKAPPSLLTAVAGLAALPIDDLIVSIVEFPHAMASRLVKSGRATKFPFLASSMRLKQDLTTDRELGSCECRSATGVVQVHFVVAGASEEVSSQ